MLSRLYNAIKGWRTLLLSAALLLVSIADVLGAIDLNALLSLWLPADKIGPAVAIISLAFGLLRLVTNGSVGCHHDKEHA